MPILSNQQARRFLLLRHGLMPAGALPPGQAGVRAFFQRVRCVQFDPLSPVAPNHDLVLHARIKGYQPRHLQELLYHRREIIDQWDKCQGMVLAQDYPCFTRHRMAARGERPWRAPVEQVLPEMMRQVENRGPLCPADLPQYSEKVRWPWGSAPIARAALETLYERGELVIHHKQGVRRYYDLARRHLDAALLNAPDPNPDEDAYDDWFVARRIAGVGMLADAASDAFLGRKFTATRRKAAFARLAQRGEILLFTLEDGGPALYIRAQDADWLNLTHKPPASRFVFLAPLDSLLWDRKLIRRLFQFDYVWEVYKPQNQRQYGYYVLPVLYRDTLAARFEPAANRKTGALEVKNWWWEASFKPKAAHAKPLRQALDRLAQLAGMQTVALSDAAKAQLEGLL